MAIRQQESTGSGSTDMKLTKFLAMLQDVDRYLSGRSGGVFMFSGTGTKYKAYYSNQLKRYNSDVFVSVMEVNFNPDKSSPLEIVEEQGIINLYRDLKNKPGANKSFNEFYRLIFWLLFSAAVSDEIYNNELPNIIDFAYCLGFDEALTRDWCKAVAYVIEGNKLSDKSKIDFETREAKAFFLHQK